MLQVISRAAHLACHAFCWWDLGLTEESWGADPSLVLPALFSGYPRSLEQVSPCPAQPAAAQVPVDFQALW